MNSFDAHLKNINIPNAQSKIYKDECAYTFHTTESDGGLFVDMNNFVGFSPEYAMKNFQATGHAVYLNIIKRKVEIPKPERGENGEPLEKKPTVLGIGVEGGFELESQRFKYEEEYAIVLLPEGTRFPYPNADLPWKIDQCAKGIIEFNSVQKKEDIGAWNAADEIKESKYAKDLKQLDNGVMVQKTGWKCSRCDLTENLWMNLTSGVILCGRKNWDGSGGNGHAMEYFNETGYPLAVKLGTISPDSPADVYSYAENNEVLDPHLDKHLAHFGIDIGSMKKTDKSVAELQLECNMNYDWKRIQENDKELQPLCGPGYTGLANLGNTCYMASVVQVLLSLPEFKQRYYDNAEQFMQMNVAEPPKNFHLQMAKLASGLLSGKYAKLHDKEEQEGVRPAMFKSLVGEGHPEFSTNQQQDSLEYFQYLMEFITRQEKRRGDNQDPTTVFRFKIQDKLTDLTCNKVRFTSRSENVLSLPVPLEKASNYAEYSAYVAKKKNNNTSDKTAEAEPEVRPRLHLQDCLNAFFAPELITDFLSPINNTRGNAAKQARMETYPPYLVLQLRKFYFENWSPKKMDVFIDVPDQFDLTEVRAKGKADDEELLPESASGSSAPAQPAFSEAVVEGLMAMGFSRNQAEHASVAVPGNNVEAATEWLIARLDDPSLNEPVQFKKAEAPKASGPAQPDESLVQQVMELGFSRPQALLGLKNTDNNAERAVDWLFNHPDVDPMQVEEPKQEQQQQQASAPSAENYNDGGSKYQLHAFISHMGSSAHSGHYVCHILKEGRWVLFNDRKVALSEDPPKDMGYVYVYKRVD
jgi:ubiquitin carboxyl-terminal hydrolase 5/13